MRRRAVTLLAAAAALAACQPAHAPSERGSAVAPTAAPAAPVCRAGAGGAPPALPVRDTERGIGGTGGPAFAERGIGGTGIGGADTGVVGVVTGFASLCLDGLEVALPAATPVRIDGASATAADLRAGQVALVGSTGAGDALTARAVAIRHEVVGPVSRVLAGGETLLVAGQTVSVSEATWRTGPVRPGDWVAISGLRTPAGTILATRIDRAPPGRVRVHGLLVTDAGGSRVGALTVRTPARAPGNASGAPGAGYVSVAGTLRDGVLVADSVAPDRLAANPAAAFGGTVRRLVVQGYVGGEGDRLRIGSAFEARAGAGLSVAPVPALGVVELIRAETGGDFVATSLRDAPLPAALPFDGAPGESVPGGDGPRSGGSRGGLPFGEPPAPRAGADPFEPAPVPGALPGSMAGRPAQEGLAGAPFAGGAAAGMPTTRPGMGGSLIPGLPPGTGAMMPPGFAGGFPGGPAGTAPGGVTGHPMR